MLLASSHKHIVLMDTKTYRFLSTYHIACDIISNRVTEQYNVIVKGIISIMNWDTPTKVKVFTMH